MASVKSLTVGAGCQVGHLNSLPPVFYTGFLDKRAEVI